MQAEFWQDRWQRNEIGFHIHKANPNLTKHWHVTQLAKGSKVFVPLCGKTLDLLWFAEQGYQVLAVELVQTAVEAFFTENQLDYHVQQCGDFLRYESANICIYCGDFFKLTANDIADCQGFYDRAALVSWTENLRHQYVQHLTDILPKGCQGLVLVVDYAQNQMSGPPFAIDQAMIADFFAGHCQHRLLDVRDILQYEPKFKQRGVTRMEEHIYWVGKQTAETI